MRPWYCGLFTTSKNGSVSTRGAGLPWNLQALFCFQGAAKLFFLSRAKTE
jgi:hypothetical protein